MPDIIIWITVFLVSLIILIISADFFIKASERIGLIMKIPPFIIGVTLIAIGTSLPELITSILAVTQGGAASAIVPGNVIGSNITNICLVLGAVGVLARKIKLEFDVMRVDLPMMLGTTLFLFLIMLDQHLSLFEGVMCLVGLVLYLAYVLHLGRSRNDEDSIFDLEPELEGGEKFSWKDPAILLISAGFIYLSANFNVKSIGHIAEILKIGQEFIALTAVALGTSLPELVVSMVAVRTDNAEMAVGNILGSNIFNILAVIGIPRLFGEIIIPESILEFSLPAVVVVTVLFAVVIQDKIINRWEGYLLLLFYLLFIGNTVATQL